MMNILGKGLVLLNLILSVFFLTVAAAIFTNQLDWGWMDPRVETKGVRIASEVDKRTAAVKQAAVQRERMNSFVKNSAAGVLTLEQRLPLNRLWYTAQLKKLHSGDGKIEIKHLDVDKTGVVLDPTELGRPKLKDDVKYTDAQGKGGVPVDKSYQSYQGDLKKVEDEATTARDDIKKLIDQQEDITVRLNGVTEDGKMTKPGLYHLLEVENQSQAQVKRETEDVRPRWAQELVEAQLLLERRLRLEKRLEQLQTARPGARK